jgi:hypothetical protein
MLRRKNTAQNAHGDTLTRSVGGLSSRILFQLFRSRPFTDGTRGVNEVPRWTLYASSPDASAAANVPDAAYSPICTWHVSHGKPRPPALSALKFVPSLSLRGLLASWRRRSQLRHVVLCRASVACARGVCAAVGERQRACGMKLAGGSRKGLRLVHGSGTREESRVS